MDARNWDTALLCIFQYHIHNIAFFENFWVKKIFLVIFELYWTELEFWILTPKNEKKYFFRYPLPNILNFWKFLGQKIFFESFWSLMNWARIFKINTKKWKKFFWYFRLALNTPPDPHTFQFFLIAAEKPRQAS